MPLRRVLVPVVVVALAAALFLWNRERDAGPAVELTPDVAACAANLRQIYVGLMIRSVRDKRPPSESGVALLAALITSGAVEDTPANRARLTCPGPGAAPVPASVDWRDPATLGRAATAYALRDQVAFPLAHFPSGGSANEPLAACDDEHGMNHAGQLNVLYSDGSVVTLSLAHEIEIGRLPPGSTTIPVGKDSPIPELQKLTLD